MLSPPPEDFFLLPDDFLLELLELPERLLDFLPELLLPEEELELLGR